MANGLVINGRSLNRRISGVERYAVEIARRFSDCIRVEGPGKPVSPPLGHIWEQVVLPSRLAKGELLWSPANMGPLSVANQVLTIHDLSVLDHPEWFHPLFARWYRTVLPLLAQRVRRVLTVSEYSRQQISRVFDLSPEKVLAIPGGVDLQHFRPATEAEMERIHQRYSLAGDYVLFVGTLEPRKNLSTLLDAWQLVWPEFPHLELVIAGSPAPNFAPASLVPNSPGVRFLGYVPDGDLPALYSGARAFLLPSLQEGFGLTVLEAMACGTPVIASSAGALPETAGVAGTLVDPLEISSWAEALYRLLIDRNRWLWFRQAGFERVREFSWQKTAERVWQALEYAA